MIEPNGYIKQTLLTNAETRSQTQLILYPIDIRVMRKEDASLSV